MKTETIIVRVAPDMKEKLEKIASNNRRELSDFLRIKFEDIINGNESIECIYCDGKGWHDGVPCRQCDITGRMTAKRWREWHQEVEDQMKEMNSKHESDELPF